MFLRIFFKDGRPSRFADGTETQSEVAAGTTIFDDPMTGEPHSFMQFKEAMAKMPGIILNDQALSYAKQMYPEFD